MATAVQSIEADLDERLADLKDERERLKIALAILKGKPATQGPRKPGSKAPRSARSARANGTMKSTIIEAVTDLNQPVSAGQIRKVLDIPEGDKAKLAKLLKTMVESGVLKSQGVRAGTRYTAS
jgi:hypothetical protein